MRARTGLRLTGVLAAFGLIMAVAIGGCDPEDTDAKTGSGFDSCCGSLDQGVKPRHDSYRGPEDGGSPVFHDYRSPDDGLLPKGYDSCCGGLDHGR